MSIADLGGTEIDLRFQNAQEGNISVVVAPVLRFSSSKFLLQSFWAIAYYIDHTH